MTLRDALRRQGTACANLGSPFMKTLLDLTAERLDRSTAVGRRMLDWPGDISPKGISVPLRYASGLHALKHMGHTRLQAVYPPNPDSGLWDAVSKVLDEEEAFLLDWMESPPQTNEVRRSSAILAAASAVVDRFGMPLDILELGSSAGLNLNFDRFAVKTPQGTLGAVEPVLTLSPDWEGASPTRAKVSIRSRRGCDIRPIDPKSDAGQLRLLSYLWPDQPDRIALTRAAISVAQTKVEKADVVDFLKTALSPTPGVTRFIFHTVVWQYFPDDTKTAARSLIEAAGRGATEDSPLAWFSMEAAGDLKGAEMRLKTWPEDHDISLGTADFHGRWINWQPEDT